MLSLVADTNILISYFFPRSTARRLIEDSSLLLYSPEYALEEIQEHTPVILRKAKIALAAFNKARSEMARRITFIPLEDYADAIREASETPDPDDVDFIALAWKMKLPLWSNDKRLKEQSLVTVLLTEEIIKLISRI
ncbi:MAG: PIN domain-containing protein [Phycisphaerae bacterium]